MQEHGILGLRVTDVARSAGVSVTSLYQHFTDRDGLIADVLSSVTEASLLREAGHLLASIGVPVLPDARPAVPAHPGYDTVLSPADSRRLRLGAHAAAVNNPQLRARLADVHRTVEAKIAGVLREHDSSDGRSTTPPEVGAALLLAINDLIIDRELRGDPLSPADQHELLCGVLPGITGRALTGSTRNGGR